MASPFVVYRVGLQRLMIRHRKHFVAEYVGTELKQMSRTLSILGLNGKSVPLQA